jgi:hypothetical protein
MDKMISEINKAWNWKGFNATKIILTNDFGNVIFKTDENEYWRICPEETSCEKIAKTELEFERLSNDSEFIEDWEMSNLVTIAKSEIGELEENQKYCLKMPAVIGGEYDKSNIGKISFAELISFSGDLGFQIKDLKDGQKIKLNIKN